MTRMNGTPLRVATGEIFGLPREIVATACVDIRRKCDAFLSGRGLLPHQPFNYGKHAKKGLR